MNDLELVRHLNAEAARQDTQDAKLGLASVMYDRLMKQISTFEKGLLDDEELGGYLASFGREIHIRIDKVGFHNPYFITFDGRLLSTGDRVRLVQHVTQINVILTAVQKLDGRGKPHRIGFSTDDAK
jgi:Family of unknown function (DUF6173)